jgi:hypothetical protein
MLKNQGFKKKKGENVYKKNGLYILLTSEHDYDNEDKAKIGGITVRVETFYLGNRIY